MTITICGSMSCFAGIQKLQHQLEASGHRVLIPSLEGADMDYAKLSQDEQVKLKAGFIQKHMTKIEQADAVLIANFAKNNQQQNYIRANTFLEMGMSYALNKPLYILHQIPWNQTNALEIAGLNPVELHEDITPLLKQFLYMLLHQITQLRNILKHKLKILTCTSS